MPERCVHLVGPLTLTLSHKGRGDTSVRVSKRTHIGQISAPLLPSSLRQKAPAWQVWEKARMRGARIYARKIKPFLARQPPHPNPLPQGEREKIRMPRLACIS